MIDPILEASADYEREVAPAYEVIRRAQARFAERLEAIREEPVPAQAAWLRRADPTEPNGAEYAVAGAIQFPEQGHPGAAVEPSAPDDAAPDSRSAAVSVPPGGGRRPSDQPGSARSGQRERRRPGRRAPSAAAADAPSTSSSGSAGTPTPVSQPPAGRGKATSGIDVQPPPAASHQKARDDRERAAGPYACSCGREFPLRRGLSRHRNLSGHDEPKPQPLGAAVTRDKRVLQPAEECPKGCGRRFTWEPSLLSHAGSCDGKAAA